MNNAKIVIGAMFGDEGKGHVTDALCDERTLNVRFNGGAQASHTVGTKYGRQHAFRHVGAGTFSGADTYLADKFIVNVFSFNYEIRTLKNKYGIDANVNVNPNCFVTTLWDMYINQAIESMRKDKRYGSCGFGIDETLQRSKYDEYRLQVKDFLDFEKLRKKLERIENEYINLRLKENYNISISSLPKNYRDDIENKENIDITLFYIKEFLDSIKLSLYDIFDSYENVVFEGAQGLMLDQSNYDYFPNVTHSNTGIKNVVQILNKVKKCEPYSVYYVTRCYQTRHGAGKFLNELDSAPYKNIVDLTNVTNEFQGSLRFAYLDFDILIENIKKDIKNFDKKVNINVVFTCFDQLDDIVKYYYKGILCEIPKNEFLNQAKSILKENINLQYIFYTDGMTKSDFKEI